MCKHSRTIVAAAVLTLNGLCLSGCPVVGVGDNSVTLYNDSPHRVERFFIYPPNAPTLGQDRLGNADLEPGQSIKVDNLPNGERKLAVQYFYEHDVWGWIHAWDTTTVTLQGGQKLASGAVPREAGRLFQPFRGQRARKSRVPERLRQRVSQSLRVKRIDE